MPLELLGTLPPIFTHALDKAARFEMETFENPRFSQQQ
jgi:hypothetical protein